MPYPPTASPNVEPSSNSVPAQSHAAGVGSSSVNRLCRSPRSLATYWTPISDASGRPRFRHWWSRVMPIPFSLTCQKKLFAERKIRFPPRSR
jgi:hypothetical protein